LAKREFDEWIYCGCWMKAEHHASRLGRQSNCFKGVVQSFIFQMAPKGVQIGIGYPSVRRRSLQSYLFPILAVIDHWRVFAPVTSELRRTLVKIKFAPLIRTVVQHTKR
jgi:hypothetical protein